MSSTIDQHSPSIPVSIQDPINAKILAISEDKIQGYQRLPIEEIARLAELDVNLVITRIRAMLREGVIRRVRQTLMATNLAKGALVAWEIDLDKLDAAFEYLFNEDPFSGHVVVRSTDNVTAGSTYKLWTTLKTPQGFAIEKHAEYLREKIGAKNFRLMPAKKLFALGVGHVRRRQLKPGSRTEEPARMLDTNIVELSDLEWRVLMAVKREFEPEEITENLWAARAEEAGVTLEEFHEISESLNARKVVGRFSTFLEHVKPNQAGERVTKFNALFHWAVPEGREVEAGLEVGRHLVLTHAYWREGGPEFKNVNIMAVAHGLDKDYVLSHKKAIDEHLEEIGIPVRYTNVFWGGRSEIKPSEISPIAYMEWCQKVGIDPESMRE
jgi:DNA-binding Lrp family transcriptional regulator